MLVNRLVRGARINRRDKDNYTPLLLAATYGHPNTVELLLHKGADFTAVDKYDKTAIYLAAEENKLTVLEVVLFFTNLPAFVFIKVFKFLGTDVHYIFYMLNLELSVFVAVFSIF